MEVTPVSPTSQRDPQHTSPIAMTQNFAGFANPFGGGGGMQTVGEHDEAADTFGAGGFNPDNRLPPIAGSSLPGNYNFNRRTSVSAESMNPSDNDENWKAPNFSKTPDQLDRLREALAPNFLFSHLQDDQTRLVIGALQEKPIPAKGIKVIQQGDEGDYFYVVEKGGFDIYVHPSGSLQPGADGLGEKVASIGPGGSFGELALMYSAPRAATVVSIEPSTLWQMDRITFRRVIMDSAFQRRRMYETFLAEVKLLSPLNDYERSKIADALNTEKYTAGQTVIQQGDVGLSFYMVEEGHAEAFKEGISGPIASYGKGDYFGELALLNNAPRAASIVAKTELKVATLGKEGFQRLLGPAEVIMRRNDPTRRLSREVDPLTHRTS